MSISDFTDLLLNEYASRNDIGKDKLKEIDRIISVGFVPEKILEKRDAAQIIHFFIRQTKIEEDESTWEKAKKLKDLYDCHSCVDHVAQIFVKGIITPSSESVFGMRNMIMEKEAIIIINRIFEKDKRIVP